MQGRFYNSFDAFGSLCETDLCYICGCYQDAGRAKGRYKIGDQVKECNMTTFWNDSRFVRSLLSQGGSIDIYCGVCCSRVELTQDLLDKISDDLPGEHAMRSSRPEFLRKILSKEVGYW